jgi:histidinol-phosphatase (PHP family)
MTPLLYETHSHTPLCKHAVGEPAEYAAVAKMRGLKGLTVTCHSPMPDGFSHAVRMAPEQFEAYVALVETTAAACEGVDVLLGMESDYFPGMESWLEKLHGRADFNYILGSIHPQIREQRQRFFRGDWHEYHKTYFEQLADAAETGLFDCLSHPDLVKILGPDEWDLEKLMPTIQWALDRIAATGIAMELNTSGVNKVYPEMNPGMGILTEVRARGIPVVIGADAHHPKRVGDGFVEALGKLREAGYEKTSYFLKRERREVGIGEALESLGEI